MTYGLMPGHDYRTLDKTLDLVCDTFPHGTINTLEIGVHKGNTSRGIAQFLFGKKRKHHHIAIDNNHDLKVEKPFYSAVLIIGNSSEVDKEVPNDRHFIFIDGNHSFHHTTTDFLIYKNKVVPGGFIAFHDTGKQIKDFTDYQDFGDKLSVDSYISCRRAIERLGLHDGSFEGWKLIFDEYDEKFPTGGIMVFQKKSWAVGDKALYLGGDIPVQIELTENDVIEINNGKGNLYSEI